MVEPWTEDVCIAHAGGKPGTQCAPSSPSNRMPAIAAGLRPKLTVAEPLADAPASAIIRSVALRRASRARAATTKSTATDLNSSTGRRHSAHCAFAPFSAMVRAMQQRPTATASPNTSTTTRPAPRPLAAITSGWRAARSRVVEGGQIYFIRTDHIGRPVFATNDLGVKVWEAELPALRRRPRRHRRHRPALPRPVVPGRKRLASELDARLRSDNGAVHRGRPAGAGGRGEFVYGYARQNPGRLIDPTGENTIAIGAGLAQVLGPGGAVLDAIAAGVVAVGGYLLYEELTDDEDCDDRTDCEKARSAIVSAVCYPHMDQTSGFRVTCRRWDICACKDGVTSSVTSLNVAAPDISYDPRSRHSMIR